MRAGRRAVPRRSRRRAGDAADAPVELAIVRLGDGGDGIAETPAGLVCVCMGCEPGGVHEVHHPGRDARLLTADFLRLRTPDEVSSFQARWGMVDPVRVGTGTPNPMHRGAGTVELVDHVLFSAGNARYQAEHAVRAVTADPATEADRRQAYAGLIATLDRMETRFAPIDDPTVVRLVPRSLRQVVGFTLLAMFRGGLPPGCRICGTPLPDRTGPGRPRLHCSTTCQNRANYLARTRRQPS